MKDVTSNNFGVLIAYLVPGATALWGISLFSPAVSVWFASTPQDAPTISGFLYLTVASLAVGMTVAAIRWACVDSIHSLTGLRAPDLDFSTLPGKVDAYNLLIEIHYRHYQFYALCRVLHKAYYADLLIMLTTRELKRLDDQRGIVLPSSSGCCMPWS